MINGEDSLVETQLAEIMTGLMTNPLLTSPASGPSDHSSPDMRQSDNPPTHKSDEVERVNWVRNLTDDEDPLHNSLFWPLHSCAGPLRSSAVIHRIVACRDWSGGSAQMLIRWVSGFR